MTRRFWVLLDYDDTLGGCRFDGAEEVIKMEDVYWAVLDRFGDRMEQEGFDREEALLEQQRIDHEMCRKHGFGDKWRFPASLKATYQSLAGNSSDQDIALAMDLVGWQVFDCVDYVPLPGAISVLESLSKHYKIAVVTKGDADEQRKKLVMSGVMPFVDSFHPLDHKNSEEWAAIISHLGISAFNKRHTWAVGNSAKSDVNEPLRMGLNAIHITNTRWAFENEEYETPQEDRELVTVESIGDILKIIPIPLY